MTQELFNALNFVHGAVSEKDVVPVLSHFCIYAGRIQGANGRVYIDAPCSDLKIEGAVPADRFLKAVDACQGEPDLKVTDKGRLIVSRDNFRAQLMTQPLDKYPRGNPSAGKKIKLPKGLSTAIRQLRPFISDDAQRPWASTIFFSRKDKAALATNSAMIAMTDALYFITDVQLPVFCADELLRIENDPDSYTLDSNSITFYWDDAWLRSQLIAAEWPVETARDWLKMKAPMTKLPHQIKKQIEALIPFCPDPKYPVIKFAKNRISTLDGDSTAEITGIDLGEAAFHATNLLAMMSSADKIAIAEKAALFTGPNNFRGVMSLLRL